MFTADDQTCVMPRQTPSDVVYQTWFRMLHLLGNPADMIINNDDDSTVVEKDNNSSCWYSQRHIPYCFYLASSAVGKMVDIFHGSLKYFDKMN